MAAYLMPMPAQVIINVNSAVPYNPTGIVLRAGESAVIDSRGIANLADANGPYETNPAGTILVAPPPGSGAYSFFQLQAGPIGIPPVKYVKKFLIPPQSGPLLYAPYGALVAGISPSANPQSEADFPDGFSYIGRNGIILARSDGYLYLSVNDSDSRVDNQGSYLAFVTAPAKSVSSSDSR